MTADVKMSDVLAHEKRLGSVMANAIFLTRRRNMSVTTATLEALAAWLEADPEAAARFETFVAASELTVVERLGAAFRDEWGGCNGGVEGAIRAVDDVHGAAGGVLAEQGYLVGGTAQAHKVAPGAGSFEVGAVGQQPHVGVVATAGG